MDKLGIPNALKPTGSSLAFDLFGLGIGMVAAQGKVNALSSKIDELVRAFPAYLSEYVSEHDDPGVWIFNAGFMLRIHDAAQGIKGLSGKDRLARAVVNASWDKILPLASEEDAKQIAEIRRRAEGRALTAK